MTTQKQALIEQILEHLGREFATIQNAARAAHLAATHEESRAEDAHDTRGLEASYLAGAQAARAAEIQAQIQSLRLLPVRDFSSGDPITVGAGVELKHGGKRTLYFLVPQGGGVSIPFGVDQKLNLISSRSPMGESLLGRKQGEDVEVESQSGIREYEITKVF